MPTKTEIRENLLDAGCSETEMRSILGSICSGNLKEAGTLFCGGISDPKEAEEKTVEQKEAYEFGKNLE